MVTVKRQTAYKCTIASILNNPYVHKEGWEPSYVDMKGTPVSRVNILATLVTKQGNSMTLDDGTGKMNVMLFTEPERADQFNIGDVLLVIGRPRDYNNSRYLVPEIMRIVQQRSWIDYRRKELELFGVTDFSVPDSKLKKGDDGDAFEEIDSKAKVVDDNVAKFGVPGENFTAVILDTIKRLDKGDGADTDEVIKESKLKGAEKFIMSLLYEGEIFEIRPGKLKVLE